MTPLFFALILICMAIVVLMMRKPRATANADETSPDQRSHPWLDVVTKDLAAHQGGMMVQIDLLNYREVLHSMGLESADNWSHQLLQRLDHDIPNLCWHNAGRGCLMGWSPKEIELEPELVASLDVGMMQDGELLCPAYAIGLVKHRDCPEPASVWVAQADCAASHAQRLGRAVVKYTAELDSSISKHLETSSKFSQAIANQDLLLHFQPIVDAHTDLPIGLEALVRWPQPDGRLAFPDAFLGKAEHSGKMQRLTNWVLSEALKVGTQIHQNHIALNIHINLSAHDLADHQLAERVIVALKQFEFDGKYLKLEVSESDLMQHCDNAIAQFEKLQPYGVSLVIDQFGYSQTALSSYNQFPISYLKLDREFVAGMDEKDHDLALVRSAIYLAHSINVPVIAEGIETAEQAAYIFKSGCSILQGFWFSKPMDTTALMRWLGQTWGSTTPVR